MVIVRRDPGGMVTMTAKSYIAIPAALRRRCGLQPGDRVLLAAVPADDTLTAYSFAVVDQAIPRPRRVPPRARRTTVTTTGPTYARPHPEQAVVDAALLMLERMGLSPDDLTAAPRQRPAVPTFADYIPVVSAAVTDGTPQGVRLVLEPGDRPVGRPPPGRADAIGDPAAGGVRQGATSCPGATPAAGAARPST